MINFDSYSNCHNNMMISPTIPNAIIPNRYFRYSGRSSHSMLFFNAIYVAVTITNIMNKPITTGSTYFRISQNTAMDDKLFPMSNVNMLQVWDLNPRSSGYEPDEIPNFSNLLYRHHKQRLYKEVALLFLMSFKELIRLFSPCL